MKKKVINCKTIILIIITAIIGILSLITLVSSIKSSNLAFLSYRFYVMESDTYSDVALKGDLVIAKKVNMDKLKIGDDVVYTDGKYNYINKVTQLKQANGNSKIIVSDSAGVSYRFAPSQLAGTYVTKINFFGNIISLSKTAIGVILFTMFCICILGTLITLLPGKMKI